MLKSIFLVVVILVGCHCPLVAQPAPANTEVNLESLPGGGFVCKNARYEAKLDANGNLVSLRAGGVEFLGKPAGFVRDGQWVMFRTVEKKSADTLIACGEPKDETKAFPGSSCPFTARVTYCFKPDCIELTLEQSMDNYGGFAWVPSESVRDSRDALTDYSIQPGVPALYGQTDPRWMTREGPVLRFDFGVWSKGYVNSKWEKATVDGKTVHFLQNMVRAYGSIKAVICPLARPEPKDALTFDISAADLDFLLEGGKPVHFDIKATNAGGEPLKTRVRFEVRDYLTQKVVASKSTAIKLAGKGDMMLPTDVSIKEPGPYRAAIVIEDGEKTARSFWWVFTYDFQHYQPANTRPPDFKEFWRAALDESAATPLDIKMTPVPDKSDAQFDVFKINYATLGGRRIYGYYAKPKAPGKYPVLIEYPSSGHYPLSPAPMPGRCFLQIQIHGFNVDSRSDLSNVPTGDEAGRNYWTYGIESPKTSMWRTIFISLVRAVDFVLAQPEVDSKRLLVMGGSQGGGLSLVAAGLDQRIGMCCAHHCGLARLDWTVKYGPGYWPFGMAAKPANQTEEEFLKTLAYFDPVNFTEDIRCPVSSEVGLMDTVTASGNQICALARIPNGLLYLVCSPWDQHASGTRPGPRQDPFSLFLIGEKPIVTPTKP